MERCWWARDGRTSLYAMVHVDLRTPHAATHSLWQHHTHTAPHAHTHTTPLLYLLHRSFARHQTFCMPCTLGFKNSWMDFLQKKMVNVAWKTLAWRLSLLWFSRYLLCPFSFYYCCLWCFRFGSWVLTIGMLSAEKGKRKRKTTITRRAHMI